MKKRIVIAAVILLALYLLALGLCLYAFRTEDFHEAVEGIEAEVEQMSVWVTGGYTGRNNYRLNAYMDESGYHLRYQDEKNDSGEYNIDEVYDLSRSEYLQCTDVSYEDAVYNKNVVSLSGNDLISEQFSIKFKDKKGITVMPKHYLSLHCGEIYYYLDIKKNQSDVLHAAQINNKLWEFYKAHPTDNARLYYQKDTDGANHERSGELYYSSERAQFTEDMGRYLQGLQMTKTSITKAGSEVSDKTRDFIKKNFRKTRYNGHDAYYASQKIGDQFAFFLYSPEDKETVMLTSAFPKDMSEWRYKVLTESLITDQSMDQIRTKYILAGSAAFVVLTGITFGVIAALGRKKKVT